MRVVVTGASGFIGRHLIAALRQEGHEAIAVVRRDPGDLGTGCILWDAEGGALDLPPGIDGLVHMAQSRRYRDFPSDADEMFAVNVAGTHTVLQAAARAGIGHLCLVSSGAVYEPFDTPIEEAQPLHPASYLGASKLAAECLAAPYRSLFPVAILRLFTPYGPGQAGRLVPDLIRRVGSRVPVSVPAGGDGMRFSPTAVSDICRVIIQSIGERWSQTVNVAAPEDISIRGAVATIGEVLGIDPVIETGPGGAPVVVPSLARLGRLTDLSRFTSFRDGLAEMLR